MIRNLRVVLVGVALLAFVAGPRAQQIFQTPATIVPGVGSTTITASSLTSRVASDFVMASNTTLANVTGLTANVTTGLTYMFEAVYYYACLGGGAKFAIAGTATATAVIYEAGVYENFGVYSVSGLTVRGVALGAAVVNDTAVSTGVVRITGTITVNVGGTLTAQFAQNASNVATSTVNAGSTFTVTPIP